MPMTTTGSRSMLLSILLILLGVGPVWAQASTEPPRPDTLKVGEHWTHKVRFDLGLSQSYFTDNWAGNEVGTVSWLSGIDALAAKQLHPKFKIENTLVLAFGQTHQQDPDTGDWLKPVKSSDKIDGDSVGRFTFGGWVDPYVAFTLDSQFYDDRPGLGSKGLNPLRLGEFAGVARPFRDTPTQTFITRLGFGIRQRIDQFHDVDPTVRKKVLNDGGFEFRALGRWTNANERTELKSDFYLFQAVYFSESEFDPANRWKQLDVRWQNTLNNKIYSAINVSLYLDFVYDAQVRRAGQLKQTLGVGLTYEL
jgi:hypothetical protein